MAASAPPRLHQLPVTQLKGVGAHMAAKLSKLHIHTLQDVLFHLPLRYQDRTQITSICHLQPQREAVIEGTVLRCDVVFGKRRSLLCMLEDASGTVALRFFHFSSQQKQQLQPGVKLRCFGEVRRGAAGLELYHPEYRLRSDATPTVLEQTLTPIYPITEGLSQNRLRNLAQQTLQQLNNENLPELLPELLPGSQVSLVKAISLQDALRLLHNPPKQVALDQLSAGQHPAQQRLALEELLAHQITLQAFRKAVQQQPAYALTHQHLLQPFFQQLPFQLTAAQQRVAAEISDDLQRPFPMLRLVQGDVGSGKTVVAALAALQAIASGKQVALMAPTEILAEQHFRNFERWFTPLNISVAWLTGRLKVSEKRKQLAAIESGTAQLVVGTHALIQDTVAFHDLALVIVDEQHRFGVQQRLTLRHKSSAAALPHQLIMTATPIPRTLAMSAYADLDCSTIDELPPGRTPVETLVVSQSRRGEVIARVNNACREGRQAYWVCTLIEESEVLEAQAAEAAAAELTLALPQLRIGLVHGRLKPIQKEQAMVAFKERNLDLLVATTVIEVGVDVPNASLMVIENPERLGLAQLHQLRGRVGRGSVVSHCVLLYGAPLSKTAKRRLAVLRSTTDGFVIAEQDLAIRGPGEVLGTRQTGTVAFKIADLERDAHLLPQVQNLAARLDAATGRALTERWLGDNPRFANA